MATEKTNRNVNYTLLTMDIDSWMAEKPVQQVAQRTRKSRQTKEIVHKIFFECSKCVDDPFWIEKFKNASFNKFPRGFNYNDGILYYKKGAKCPKLDVKEDPFQAANECMEFFKLNGGIFSSRDDKNSIELQSSKEQIMSKQKPLSWGEARKKTQENLICHYATGMRDVMGLSKKETQQLIQTIKNGVSNKVLGKHNITLETNRIHTIDGLYWNETERKFYLDPNLKPVITRTYVRKKTTNVPINNNEKDTIPQFTVKWIKYIDALSTKIQKSTKRSVKNNSQLTPTDNIPTSTDIDDDDDDDYYY